MNDHVKCVAIGVLGCFLLFAPAMADELPEDGKMHYPQWPDVDGWSVAACFGQSVADDWECPENGLVDRIRFWGSWRGGNIGTITSFVLTIYSDIPDPDPGNPLTWSMPGEVLWTSAPHYSQVEKRAASLDQGVWAGWYNPASGYINYPDHDTHYRYDFLCISSPLPVTAGETYWLEITANVADEGADPQPQWGWRSTEDHWNDDAVFPLPLCLAPDDGSGTVGLPADCDFTSPDEVMMIIDGLPPGTTIELDPTLTNFYNKTSTPGGTLGGEIITFDSYLHLEVSGTGELTGFTRHLAVPVGFEVHIGPRTPGDPEQVFPAEIYSMYGPLYGDPDFCSFFLRGGVQYGLPSPGQVTLSQLPSGDFAVESFFDITYQIEFEGCPDGSLADLSGTTTATIRMEQGGETTWMEIFEPIAGGDCVAPDNGFGTADLPPPCQYGTIDSDPMLIVDGLPPGTTIEMPAVLDGYDCDGGGYCSIGLPPGDCEGPGGSLGGHAECFGAYLYLSVEGTGSLAGFTRNLAVPVSVEIHTGSRNPGDPIQSMPADLFRLQGELFGDPDFCTFRVVGGTDYGLPSPGQTVLTRRGDGLYDVESFFDVTYQIEFEGCPGSPLEDYMGTTTATVRFFIGDPPVEAPSMDMAYLIDGWTCCGKYTDHTWPCNYTGNTNCSFDGKRTLSDITQLIDNVYISKAPLCCQAAGNTNGSWDDGDCKVTLSDVTKLIDAVYISKNLTEPCILGCETWWRANAP